jgi:GWxTD domain-containing protein
MYFYHRLLFVMVLLCVSDIGAQRDSLDLFKRSVVDYPDSDFAWLRLGHVLLQREDLDGAEAAFQKALQIEKSAKAYTGLGQVYAVRGNGLTQRAFQTFRMALGVDGNYAPAQLEMARLHSKLRSQDAEAAYRRAIEMDPTLAVAYRELILWYENAQLDWEDELVQLCQQYIVRWPDDAMGYYHLALIYVEQHQYEKVYRLAERAAQRFTDDLSWLPMMAQAEAVRGNSARALVLFEQFFESVSKSERRDYADLSLVATKAEIQALASAPASAREETFKQFWRTRSGAAMLGGDARRAEHYRRVWYAKNYFGRHQKPWDKRGEVYIRYGEPDYRSRSGRENEIPSVAVQQFKLHKIDQIAELRGRNYDGRQLPVMYPDNVYLPGSRPDLGDVVAGDLDRWVWEVETPGGMIRLNLPLGMQQGIEPAALIDRDQSGNTLMPWESWVYLEVGNGMEFTFTDRFMSGKWDFPLVPATLENLQLITEVNNTQPAVAFMSISSSVPEKFTVPPGVAVLDFYYDVASFRGADGQPQLEVYFGIPPEHIQSNRIGDFIQLKLAHNLILANEAGDAISQTRDERTFQARADVDALPGLFVDVAHISALPGRYTLGVKLIDQLSGKWNLYQQVVEIPSFADTLALSDIEMAWDVSEKPQAKKFRKGDVWVVPEPTRRYEGRDVHLYYEVYNLTLDAFGQAKYRVDYTIRENIQNGRGVVGVMASGLKRFFQARQEPEFRVGYERSGSVANEPIFFELETKKLKPGLKEVVVTITDLNGHKTVSQSALFWVGASSQ